jgi:hypothetical protein
LRWSIQNLGLGKDVGNRELDDKKGRTWQSGAAFLCLFLYRDLGSFDCVDRTTVYTSTTIRACRCIDHMLVALLADGVNRACVNTGGAVDTLVVNCVGHGTYLLF